jgi:hypothetical protein
MNEFRGFEVSSKRLSSSFVNACAGRCLSTALRKSGTELIEPVMLIELTLISDDSGSIDHHVMIDELTTRRANIIMTEESISGRD